MTQLVRRVFFGVESGLTDIFLYQPLDRLYVNTVALFADKQRVRVLLVRLQAFGQILLECGKTRIVEKYRPLLAALPSTRTVSSLKSVRFSPTSSETRMPQLRKNVRMQ